MERCPQKLLASHHPRPPNSLATSGNGIAEEYSKRPSPLDWQFASQTLRWCQLSFRSTESIKAENLFLRRQLALCVERSIKPRRVNPVTRISLTMLSRKTKMA